MAEASSTEEPRDFSVIAGGPFFDLLLKLHLSGSDLELLHRRLLVLTPIAWLPLFFFSVFAGMNVLHSFLRDVEVHVRFLVALPVLLSAELIVHTRMRPMVRAFVDREIVYPQDLPRFYRSVKSAIGLRNSIALELGILTFVYCLGPWITLHRIDLENPHWYAMPGARLNLTTAGWWYVFVSVPIVQFILLRWYARLVIWFRFLWQVSRMSLHLIPTHPDRSAGIGFLGRSAYAFSPILFAEGTLLAGLVASEILYQGKSLLSFKWQIGGVIAFFIFVVMAPLFVFTLKMARAKRQGLAEYGLLAQQYVTKFEKKWVLGVSDAPPENLLGVADIQSLADLGNSYSLVRDMRLVPFGLQDISRLVVATAVPLLPLMLTIFPPEELIFRIYKLLF
jgi:hypothetical protein